MAHTENRSAEQLDANLKRAGRIVFGKVLQWLLLPIAMWFLAQSGLLVTKNIVFSAIWLFVIAAALVGPVRYYRDQRAMKLKPTYKGYETYRATNRARAWVVPVVLLVSFVVIIFSNEADNAWAWVMGNHIYGSKGWDWSLVVAIVSSWAAMFCYYALLRTIYVRSEPTRKVVVLAIIAPLLFILPMGLSIVKNFGA